MEELGVKFVGFDGVSAVAMKVSHAVEQVREKVEQMSHTSEKAGRFMEGLAGKFEGLLAIFGIGGATFALEQLIEGTMRWTTGIAQLTAALNGNSEAASLWVEIASKFDVPVKTVAMGLRNFSDQISNNGAVLKELGIATVDTHGHLRDIESVIRETADWFQKHAGATNEATLAAQLFGRNWAAILPLLQRGSAGLAAIEEEARRYGLVLDHDVVEHQMALNYQIREGEVAVKGLTMNLGMALMPAVAALAQGLSNFVSGHLNQFIAAVNSAVSFVIGIGEAMGFWDSSASAAAQTLGVVVDASDDYGSATSSGTDSIKAQTQAIDDQVRAIEDENRAFGKMIDDQIKGIEDARHAAKFESDQTKIKQDEADKQKAIDKLKLEYRESLYPGDLTKAYATQESITKAQQDFADLQTQYAGNAADEQAQAQIDSLKQQKDAHHQALDDQKRILEDQKRAVQSAADAVLATNRTMTAKLPGLYDDAGKAAAEKFKFAVNGGAEESGKNFLNNLLLGLGGEKEMIWDTAAHKMLPTGKVLFPSFNALGKAVGTALANGVVDGLKTKLASDLGDFFNPTSKNSVVPSSAKWSATQAKSFWDWLNTPTGIDGSSIPGLGGNFDSGGRVPGATGQAVPIIAHGGEVVLNQGQQRALHVGDPAVRLLLASIDEHLSAIRWDQGPHLNGQTAVLQTGG